MSRGSEIPDDAATAGEAGLRPVTFDSQELENLGKTVDLSKEKIDKFLEVMTEKKAETPTRPAGARPEKTPEPPTGTLPPWASTMKGAPVFPEDTGTCRDAEAPRRRARDAGYGRGRDLPAAEAVGLDHGASGKGEPGPASVRTAPRTKLEEGEEEREEEGTPEDERSRT